jgi:DNA-binding SARP family transcriptional activator
MSSLHINLFGRVRVTLDDWRTEIRLTRGTQALLAYLLIHRDRLNPREVLAGIFWGDNSQANARTSLNTALWRLRSVLEPPGVTPGTYLVGINSGEVGFNPDTPLELDIAIFEDRVRQVLALPFNTTAESDVLELEQVLRLYQGDLLEGFYEDWVLRERERLRSLYLKSLRYLLRYDIFHTQYEKGLIHGQQILDLDPLQEEIHREIMRLYMATGQRTQAMRQFEICRKILAEEMNILPMPETQSLYNQIMSRQVSSHDISPPIEFGELKEALSLLSQAIQAVTSAHLEIQQALKMIEKYTGGQSPVFPTSNGAEVVPGPLPIKINWESLSD